MLYLLDSVSRAGVRDPGVWNAYANRVRSEVASCSAEELCAIVRALCRANFAKRSLLNAASRRLREVGAKLPPRLLAQALNDLRKLGHLDGPLLLSLIRGASPRLPEFQTFDLPLVLVAFARASIRDEKRIGEVGRVFLGRRAEMTPSMVSMAFYALALLDCGEDGTAAALAAGPAPRCLTDSSCRTLVNLAFALVTLDLPAAELLSFTLERAARLASQLAPQEVHALRIVEHCVRLPEALRPAMRADFAADAAAGERCSEALRRITAAAAGITVPYDVRSSRMQNRLTRFFDRLQVPHLVEEAVGPYLLDYVLPQQVAVEVDGYKHYYAFSRRYTAKSALKLRVLRAMGWRVVTVPHFEWLPLHHDDRTKYLASQIEAATGAPVAALRRRAGGDKAARGMRSPWMGRRPRPWPELCAEPARGLRPGGR